MSAGILIKGADVIFTRAAVASACAMIFLFTPAQAQTSQQCQIMADAVGGMMPGVSGMLKATSNLEKQVDTMRAMSSAKARPSIDNFEDKRVRMVAALREFIEASRELRNTFERCS